MWCHLPVLYREKTVTEILWPEFTERPPKEIGVKRRDIWQRMQAGLYLMAVTGWSVVQELIAGLAEKYSIQPNADSLHRIFRLHLREVGFLHYQVLPHAIKNGLAVVRLTDLGKSRCSTWGWSIVQSDWEKLIEHHDGDKQLRHTAMVLDFAWQARRRGYTVEVLPAVESKYLIPDVCVEGGADYRVYVEVERGRNKLEKWHHLLQLQGFIAVCVTNQTRRKTIVQKEIQPLGYGGIATDLETLKKATKREEIQNLWLDKW